MKVKTAELSGEALDWAVAKCENVKIHIPKEPFLQAGKLLADGKWDWDRDCGIELEYSINWSQAGPIIEREGIQLGSTPHSEGCWWFTSIADTTADGPTPLIAAMRCYVSRKLGEEVEIPDELCK